MVRLYTIQNDYLFQLGHKGWEDATNEKNILFLIQDVQEERSETRTKKRMALSCSLICYFRELFKYRRRKLAYENYGNTC